jgi:hypothetical protein
MAKAYVLADIEAELSFRVLKEEYGCEIDLETVEIDSLSMFGRDWSESDLRATFGDQGAEAMRAMILAEVEDWEDE